MKKIIFASNNPHKLIEVRRIFDKYKVLSLKEIGFEQEIVEDGLTFEENALIKARTVMDYVKTHLKFTYGVLADDSGLSVEVLGGAPGVYSARYAGDGDDEHNNDKLLSVLDGEKNRKAKFICCMVYYVDKNTHFTVTGETEGEILYKREGKNGFGYDPIFFSYDLNKSMGIASDEEKNSVSHRSRALKEIVKFIK